MKKALVGVLAAALSVTAVGSAAAAGPLKIRMNGWYVFDGAGTADRAAKDGVYRRCASSRKIIGLAGRYTVSNRAVPSGTTYSFKGPSGIKLTHKLTGPVGSYYVRVYAAQVNRKTLPAGKYSFRILRKGNVLAGETLTVRVKSSC